MLNKINSIALQLWQDIIVQNFILFLNGLMCKLRNRRQYF